MCIVEQFCTFTQDLAKLELLKDLLIWSNPMRVFRLEQGELFNQLPEAAMGVHMRRIAEKPL